LIEANHGAELSLAGSGLKVIVFDMDGTLVSSLSLIHHCVNRISRKYINKSLTLEEVISNFGPPARTIIRNLTATLSGDLQSRAVSDYYECYRENVSRKALVFPGIVSLLQRIRASRKHLALVTGVEKTLMEYTLNAFDLSKFFETLITGDDVRNGKPDPEGVNLALARIEANPRESILIGDSPADILAGKQAGVLTGAALWSPENRGDPTTEHPDYEFRSIQQLSDFLFPKKREVSEVYLAPRWTET